MEARNYTVVKIEGEYATLKEEDGENTVFIALALLPEGTDMGSRLRWEMFSYTLILE